MIQSVFFYFTIKIAAVFIILVILLYLLFKYIWSTHKLKYLKTSLFKYFTLFYNTLITSLLVLVLFKLIFYYFILNLCFSYVYWLLPIVAAISSCLVYIINISYCNTFKLTRRNTTKIFITSYILSLLMLTLRFNNIYCPSFSLLFEFIPLIFMGPFSTVFRGSSNEIICHMNNPSGSSQTNQGPSQVNIGARQMSPGSGFPVIPNDSEGNRYLISDVFVWMETATESINRWIARGVTPCIYPAYGTIGALADPNVSDEDVNKARECFEEVDERYSRYSRYATRVIQAPGSAQISDIVGIKRVKEELDDKYESLWVDDVEGEKVIRGRAEAERQASLEAHRARWRQHWDRRAQEQQEELRRRIRRAWE